MRIIHFNKQRLAEKLKLNFYWFCMGQRSQEYHNNMVFFDKKIFEEDFFVNQQLQVSCSRASSEG